MARLTQRDAARLIRKREEFTIGALSARSYYDYRWTDSKGKMRRGVQDVHQGWNQDDDLLPRPGMLYVVFSFATPIAWVDDLGRWVSSPRSYSSRTGQHQSHIEGWRQDDDPTDDPKLLKARALRKKEQDAFVAQWRIDRAEQARQRKNEAARTRRRWERERRQEAREREIQVLTETNEAIRSILNGPAPKPLLLGVEGEREAMESIVRDAYTSDAGSRRVTTRT